MKEIFQTLNSQNINGFVFMYHEQDGRPGLIWRQGYVSLCINFVTESNWIVCYKVNSLMKDEIEEFKKGIYAINPLTYNVDLLMSLIVDFTQKYLDNIYSVKNNDKLKLVEQLRDRLKKARVDFIKGEYEAVEKIAEENGLNSAFVYMEEDIYNLIKNKQGFKDLINKK